MVALATAFIILFLSKSGLRDKAILYCKVDVFAEMLGCDFCLSFWLGLIISLIMSIIDENLLYLCIPIFSAPISRYLQ